MGWDKFSIYRPKGDNTHQNILIKAFSDSQKNFILICSEINTLRGQVDPNHMSVVLEIFWKP